MANQSKIILGVAGPDFGVINRDFSVPLEKDSRFHLAIAANNMQILTMSLAQGEPDLLIIYGDIAPSPDDLAGVLANLKHAIAIVLLPMSWASTQGMFENLASVKKVFPLPVVSLEVLNAAESLVRTAQAIASSTSPMQAAFGPGAAAPAMGTRIIAFTSAQGGTGKTTLSASLAYELAVRRSIQTLLCAFDNPSPVPLHLNLHYSPHAGEFFARPGRGGFEDSLQKHKSSDCLQVLLAPQDPMGYGQAARRSEEAMLPGASAQTSSTSIRSLLLTAYSKMYAAVILDLPSADTAWTWHSLAVSNTVIIVARPTLDSIKMVGYITDLLTKMLSTEHQFQRNSIYIVLNMHMSKSAFTPVAFSKEVSEAFGWCPPVIASFDYDPEVVTAQNNQRPPVEVCSEFSKGIIGLANSFWPQTAGGKPLRSKGKKLGFLTIVKDEQ